MSAHPPSSRVPTTVWAAARAAGRPAGRGARPPRPLQQLHVVLAVPDGQHPGGVDAGTGTKGQNALPLGHAVRSHRETEPSVGDVVGDGGRTQAAVVHGVGDRLEHVAGKAEQLEGEDGRRPGRLHQVAPSTEAGQVGHVGRGRRRIGPDDNVSPVVHVEARLDAVLGEGLEHRWRAVLVEDAPVEGAEVIRVAPQGPVQQHQGQRQPEGASRGRTLRGGGPCGQDRGTRATTWPTAATAAGWITQSRSHNVPSGRSPPAGREGGSRAGQRPGGLDVPVHLGHQLVDRVEAQLVRRSRATNDTRAGSP